MTADPKSLTAIDARIGQRIKTRRMLLGMSQSELGRSSGVTFQQIQKYERGTNRLSVSRLHDIAEALGVPVAFFYEGAPGGGSAGDVVHLLGSPDAIGLLKAFRDIGDASIRRGLVALTKQLARRAGARRDIEKPEPSRRSAPRPGSG
jgi:transcriptional regulator with XRE-family HTH domain